MLLPGSKDANRYGKHHGSCGPAHDPQIQRDRKLFHYLRTGCHVHDYCHQRSSQQAIEDRGPEQRSYGIDVEEIKCDAGNRRHGDG